MPKLQATTEWLRANIAAPSAETGPRVDRQNNVIHGYVVAQEGQFKSEGRGGFDGKSLRQIVKLMKATKLGLKSRFTHPDVSSDSLGKHLGRAKNPQLDTLTVKGDDGAERTIEIVRADLHIDPTALKPPPVGGPTPLGVYVMDLAESDPAAFSSSLVLQADKEYRLEKDGTAKKDEHGEPLPPLWRPTRLHASDVVDTGDAVDSFLSAGAVDALPDAVVRRASELLTQQFAGQPKDAVRARCHAWLERCLSRWDEPAEGLSANVAAVTEPSVSLAIAIGDTVTWLVEDEDLLAAERYTGTVEAVSADGPLGIDGTSLTLDGTPDDPAVRVMAQDDYGACWYLVAAAELTKVEAVADMAPAVEEQKGGGDADEALHLEIDAKARELST